jgi:excisionase family DNA binding protein
VKPAASVDVIDRLRADLDRLRADVDTLDEAGTFEVTATVTIPVLLSVAEVAKLLGCSPKTVRARIAEHELPAIRDHGRLVVRGDDLRAYVDAMERVGGRPRRRPRARRGSGWGDVLRNP